MAYKILKIIADTHEGVTRATPVNAVYLDGYIIAERRLEGIPFRYTVADGNLVCQMILDEDDRKALMIDRTQVEAKGLEEAKTWEVFSVNSSMNDDDGIIYDDNKPLDAQSFCAAPEFEIVPGD